MNNNDNPRCVICRKVLPNSSMAPAKMRRHLESVHGELKENFLIKYLQHNISI